MAIEFGMELLVGGLMTTTAIAAGLVHVFYHKSNTYKRELRTLRGTFNHLHEGYYRTSLDGRQLSANPALVKLNGYDTEKQLLTSVKSISREWYVDPDRRSQFRDILLREGKVVNFVSEIYRHKTRERIWISENARVVYDEDTLEPLYYEGTVREITDEIRHREFQDRLVKLAANLPGGLFQMTMSPDGHFTAPYLSARFHSLVSRPETPFQNDPRSYLDYIHKDDRQDFKAHFHKSISELCPVNVAFRYQKPDGTHIWLKTTATVERDDDGATTWHGHIYDITEQKLTEEKTRRLAYTDALTGLPKRSVVEDKLRATIAQCARRKEYAACLFIDLDNFKILNDVHGHEAGDELLAQVAKRMQSLIRASDVLSRYGGDEFVVVVDNLGADIAEAKDKAGRFAAKICNSFKDAFVLRDLEHTSSPSIGVAIIEPDKPNLEEVVKRADNAMYQAKKNGRNNYVIFGGQKNGGKTGLSVYGKDLVGATDRNEFELVYQPQVDQRGEIQGAEAFIRWNHPTDGTLTPGEFMSAAERNGTLVEINDWVINQAIDKIAEWETRPETEHLTLAINLGTKQFSAPNFTSRLESKLYKAGIAREKLIIELTESDLTRNIDQIRTRMHEIKGCGVRFALDDFGIGSVSLASLNHLPFDQVKIDGFLVSSIESEAGTRSLVDGILGLANALSLQTVAEHVSNEFQEAYLREKGCELAQGFHYFPPLPIAEFDERLAEQYVRNSRRLTLAG